MTSVFEKDLNLNNDELNNEVQTSHWRRARHKKLNMQALKKEAIYRRMIATQKLRKKCYALKRRAFFGENLMKFRTNSSLQQPI